MGERRSENSKESHKKLINAVSVTKLEKGVTFVNILFLSYIDELTQFRTTNCCIIFYIDGTSSVL
jgi:hypothetical protein